MIENAKPWKDVVTINVASLKYPTNSLGDAVCTNPFLGSIGCDDISMISKFSFSAIFLAKLFNLFH